MNPITEAELHAWVDAELPPSRRAEVDAYLAGHPEEAARVHAWLAQKQALAARFREVLDEALPPRLAALGRAPARIGHWRQIAAGFLVAMVAGTAGWVLRDRWTPAERVAAATPATLAHHAAVAHAVFSPDVRRPVEIGADHEDQLVTWLSKRLGTPVRPPRLAAQGFELVGGRLLPGSSGPVAQFMYQDAGGQRLTLYVTTENAANGSTAFRFAREGTVNVFYWIDGSFGYALSAGVDKARLAEVATAVYDQVERRPR